MASIHLSGVLTNSLGDVDVGGVMTFTHLTTTGETIASTKTELIVPPDGSYSIDVEYGLIRIDYTTDNTQRFIATVIVNSDSTATSIPELLSATTPVAKPVIIQMQGLVADAVAAETAAGVFAGISEAFANQLTTVGLISSSSVYAADTTITTKGYTSSGDGGAASWVQNGVTGQTASRSPSQLGNALLNDALGNQWVMTKNIKDYNVKAFGAVGDGVTNDSLAFQAALDSGFGVYIPKGNYAINCNINQKIVITGDGSLNSRLKPFDNLTSALNYTYTAQISRAGTTLVSFWDYHSEVRNVGFYGVGQTGVGFSFGRYDATEDLYQANDELANNVKFYGCHFHNLRKGVSFSYGNIGTEFYSCGFRFCYYGVYLLNNKFGPIMHAGNKHFFGGEMSSNTCAVYIHNGTAAGFGDVSLKDTIIESNRAAFYLYSNAGSAFKPNLILDGVWLEGNGANAPIAIAGATLDIDDWSGSTRTTQTVNTAPIILDGSNLFVIISNSGVVGGIHLKSTKSVVKVDGSFIAQDSGNGSELSIVTDPLSSSIRQIDCFGTINSQASRSIGIQVEGRYQKALSTVGAVGATASSNWWKAPLIRKVCTQTPDSLVVSASGVTAMTIGGGNRTTQLGTVVSDGVAHNECTEFSYTDFTVGNLVYLFAPSDTNVNLPIGYHVLTFSVKCTAGSLSFNWWNRGPLQGATGMVATEGDGWSTYISVIQADSPALIQLDCVGLDNSGLGNPTTWRMADVQIHSFEKLSDAQSFVADATFYV